ncbi:MAG: hypothetical protein DRH57_00695 [Candidatus Cloacimonadota bacterium]|nr:MAG: hypothetical protein DRH57_00695 [Candidatus Cloacimonadota bacterium]
MLISIIIPAYNRAEEIDELLDSFSKQEKKNFEIIIVDDGSTDNTKDIVKSYQSRGMAIRYFYQQNKGPGPARNNGMKKANGDVFVFIDSDCTVPNDYTKNLERHLTSENIDAYGGPDTYREDFPPLLKAINYTMTSFLGTGGTRGTTGKSVAKYYPRSFNMGIRKEVYKKIGGMNNLRHGQDMEFSNRIYNAGFNVKFLPDVFVYHKRRTSMRRFFKQIFNWGVTRNNLGRIDKEMMKFVHFLPSIVILTMLIIIILSILSKFFYPVLLSVGLVLIVLLIAFIQSAKKYHSVYVGVLSAFMLIWQVIAYGLGFITGFIKSIFTKQGEIKGFTKKYYQ